MIIICCFCDLTNALASRTPLPSAPAASLPASRRYKGSPLLRDFPSHGQSPYSDSGFRRVWLKQNPHLKGWNSQAHRELPGKFESSNLSRDNLSREIGRTGFPIIGDFPSSPLEEDGRRDRRGLCYNISYHVISYYLFVFVSGLVFSVYVLFGTCCFGTYKIIWVILCYVIVHCITWYYTTL